jgi:putative transposase
MIQMVGRGLHTVDPEEHPGIVKTDCVVLDFGTSSLIHGTLEQDVDLDGKTETGEAPTKTCPSCEAEIPLAATECPLCGEAFPREDPDTGEGGAAAPLSGFMMTEIDLLKRSSFAWVDLFGTDDALMATGFTAWGGIFWLDGVWYAIGGAKGERPHLLGVGSMAARWSTGAVKGSWVEAGVAAPYPTLMTKRDPFKYFKTSSEIIRLAIMMYVRFPLSLRNVEDLLHERGIDVSHEAVRHWWHRFGPMFAAEIKKRRIAEMKSCRWRWHLDEVFVKINGERHYLWRAVDHEGEVLESFVTKSRDKKAALKFLKKAMRKHGQPEVIVTDGLLSYGAALKEIGAAHRQETGRWLNNRAENSHLPFRRRERAMLRFRRMRSLQKFASVHASVYNLFNSERSLTSRANFKMNRAAALAEWRGLGAA